MLRYDGPPYRYTTSVPLGIRAARQELARHFGLTRHEVVRDRSRCAASESEHCECRAIDLFSTLRPHRRLMFETLVKHADELDVQSVIADRRVWGFGRWYERDYTGDPHDDHVHVGFNKRAGGRLTVELVQAVLAGTRVPDHEEDDMGFTLEQLAAAFWERPTANLITGKDSPAHNILEWALLDANTAVVGMRLLSAQLQQVELRLTAIEQKLASS